MGSSEYGHGKAPMLWRMLEGILMNFLVLCMLIVVFVTILWEAVKEFFHRLFH